MSDQLRGLLTVLRRSRTQWSSFDGAQIRAAFLLPHGDGVAPTIKGNAENEGDHSPVKGDVVTPSAFFSPSSRLDRRLSRKSSFQTSGLTSGVGVAGKSPSVPIPNLGEENTAATQRSPVSLSSGSQDEPVVSKREGDDPLCMSTDNFVCFARCTRARDCHLSSLASSEEKGAYAKVAVANSKVCCST